MGSQIVVKAGRERPLRRGHPWVMSGAVDGVRGHPAPGETVDVVSAAGEWLGRGAWSPASAIRCRLWTRVAEEAVDEGFMRRRVEAAIAYRQALGWPEAGDTALRLVHGEADGLPGVTIDRYGEVLVGQFLSCGAEAWKATLVDAAMALTGCAGFYERSDTAAREREGLTASCGLLRGEAPPELVTIREGALRFMVDVRTGHKTGFYLDQRENRKLVAAVSRDRDVLNAFAYTGGFGLAALAGGARSVLQVDTSAEALSLASRHAELNSFAPERWSCQRADVFVELRRCRDSRISFDLIILDPPKFADSRSQLEGACRGYKDINLLALKLLRPGGLLFTFSCSGAMTPELFRKVVADAAIDAGREAVALRELTQGLDHPQPLHLPEARYLTGLQVRVR